MTLQRIVEFYPAWDKRSDDPRTDYGVHGVELLMLVLGDRGAIQFKVFTNWMLPHVQAEQDRRTLEKAQAGIMDKYDISALYHPTGADLGYHAKVAQYDDQTPIQADCKWTGGSCYYDGSGLMADDVLKLLIEQRLETEYKERLGHD
jgi:hypothetical protein